MFTYLINLLNGVWLFILNMFGLWSNKKTLKDKLDIFVKTNTGEQVALQLDPECSVAQVKADLAHHLRTTEETIRIIFAGKALPDDLIINQCDLGQHSILHVVRTASKPDATTQSSASISQNATALSITSAGVKPPAPTITPSYSQETEVNPSIKDSSNEESSSVVVPMPDAEEVSGAQLTNTHPKCAGRLLCDASTVMTIQMSEEEQQQIKELKSMEGERAHFYVYCARPCAAVRVGKLRVRCSTCSGGAFVLHRDPCCWQDVLTPGQISGTCEQPGCHGTSAEFFFKCRDHETLGEDDTAVALYLVRANLPQVPCLACTDISTPVIVFPCTAAHVMCLDCFVTYCVSRLNERQFELDKEIGYTLPCPAQCPDSQIQEVHHFKLMGEHHYDRYQRFGTEEAVLAAGGVLCPHPGCGMGILPDEDCRRVVCSAGCGYVFCSNCLQGYHIGECIFPETGLDMIGSSGMNGSYSVDPERAAQSRWDDASNIALRVLSKPCPKCRAPTERDGGCMHMVCTQRSCQFHWCWVCQTEWTRECMGAHWFG
ncbi:E3 ubiquitin-protein ligase parkin isoform X2 [Oratosquilla oratoria]